MPYKNPEDKAKNRRDHARSCVKPECWCRYRPGRWAGYTEEQKAALRAHSRAWKARNPGRHKNEAPRVRDWGQKEARRRAKLAEVADRIVRLDMDGPCGVCGERIDPNEKHPSTGHHNPEARTVGHEPPLSRAAGAPVVYERPEHWRCNIEKWDRTDDELLDSLLQPTI